MANGIQETNTFKTLWEFQAELHMCLQHCIRSTSFCWKKALREDNKGKTTENRRYKKKIGEKMEKFLISQTYDTTEQKRDEIIAEIDKRNKGYKPKRVRLFGGSYRRNPVLSTLLKEKYGDHCQICDLILEVRTGSFAILIMLFH